MYLCRLFPSCTFCHCSYGAARDSATPEDLTLCALQEEEGQGPGYVFGEAADLHETTAALYVCVFGVLFVLCPILFLNSGRFPMRGGVGRLCIFSSLLLVTLL